MTLSYDILFDTYVRFRLIEIKKEQWIHDFS